MANEQNLTQKGKRLSTEEAQRLAKRSVEVRREKSARIKTAREFAEAALNAEVTDKSTGKKIVVKDAIIQKLVAKAIQENDLATVKYLFELVGESPTQKMDVTTNGKDIGTQLVFSPTPLSEKDIQEIKDIQNGVKENSNDTGISEA